MHTFETTTREKTYADAERVAHEQAKEWFGSMEFIQMESRGKTETETQTDMLGNVLSSTTEYVCYWRFIGVGETERGES